MIQVGKPVIGKDFLGRQKEAFELKQYLKMGQSVVLIAPRRFGKTSLVLEVLRQLKQEKHFTGFVDVFAHASMPMLCHSITSEVLENNGLKKAFHYTQGSISKIMKDIKLKAIVADFEFIVGLEDKTVSDWENLNGSIDFINDFAKKNKKKMVFAFDEYGDILKYDKSGEIIKLMRSKIQQQQSACYIFSGSYESVMHTLFVDNKSPFYRMARLINISYLEKNILLEYYLSVLQKYNIDMPNEQLNKLLDFLKCHPYYSQLALQQILFLYQINGNCPSKDEVITQIVNIDNSYLEKTWEDISANRENALIIKHLSSNSKGIYALASKKGINASRSLSSLIGKGVLYKSEKEFEFYDPILKYWISKNILI